MASQISLWSPSKSIISNQNNIIIKDNKQAQDQRTCNCVKKDQCPINNECLKKNIIYQATVTSDMPNYREKVYIGLAATTFKQRYANHKKSLNTLKYKNATELSKEVWNLKDKQYTPSITWKILRTCGEFNRTSMKCNLCLAEKLEIAMYANDNILNKRSELVSKCRHVNKHKLFQKDSKD